MKVISFKQIKYISLLVFVLAILFIIFFDKSKHVPFLKQANPFAVDPYDAVGSFGIQFVFFVAFLTVLRAFRPYMSHGINSEQEKLIVRCNLMVVISIATVLVGDIIGMLRQPSLWISSPGGWILALSLVGMIGLTVLTGWMIFHTSRTHIRLGSWKTAAFICPVCILILVIYPPAWDEGVIGGIATAGIGMLIFFISVWALSIGFSPESDLQAEDIIDDLGAIYIWEKNHAGIPRRTFQMIENFMLVPCVRSVVEWLNPRKHVWNLLILIAVGAGVTLAIVEAIAEGTSSISGRVVIVSSVFIGLETVGILLAYGLLARFLIIFRTMKSV